MRAAVTTVVARTLQTPQAADIEMIHVRMGEQDNVDLRQLGQGQCGLHQPLQSQCHGPEADTRARAENRIGEDCYTIDLEQHGGMAQPGGVQAGIGPEMRARTMRRRRESGA